MGHECINCCTKHVSASLRVVTRKASAAIWTYLSSQYTEHCDASSRHTIERNVEHESNILICKSEKDELALWEAMITEVSMQESGCRQFIDNEYIPEISNAANMHDRVLTKICIDVRGHYVEMLTAVIAGAVEEDGG